MQAALDLFGKNKTVKAVLTFLDPVGTKIKIITMKVKPDFCDISSLSYEIGAVVTATVSCSVKEITC